MTNYETIAARVLSRRDRMIVQQKKRNAVLLRCTAVGGSLCLCGVIAVGVYLGGQRAPEPGIDPSAQNSRAEETTTATVPMKTTISTVTTASTESTVTTYTTATGAETTFTTMTTLTTQSHITTTAYTTTIVSQTTTTGSATSEQTTTQEEEEAVISPWQELEIYAQYIDIPVSIAEQNGGQYRALSSALREEQLGTYVETVQLAAYDLDDVLHETTGEIYLIEGVSPECGVAIRYAGTEEYYAVKNQRYMPETLGQMFDDMNLYENMEVSNTVYHEALRPYTLYQFTADADRVWEIVFSDLSLENLQPFFDVVCISDVSFNVTTIFGISAFWLDVDGYLCTNLADYGARFPFPQEEIAGFIDYLFEECPYEDITNVPPENSGQTE